MLICALLQIFSEKNFTNMKLRCYFLTVTVASRKPQFINGVLQSADTDGLFDPDSMWDLGYYLANYPVRKPNNRVEKKVFVESEQGEREVVVGWSCTFDKGLCKSWMTKDVLSDSIREDISMATRLLDGTQIANWYIRKDKIHKSLSRLSGLKSGSINDQSSLFNL